MPNTYRERPIQMHFFVTEDEKNFILEKQKNSGIKTVSDYLRKMAIDGQIIGRENEKEIFDLLKKIEHNIGAISRNINQVVKKIHGFGTVDEKDLDNIKEMMKEIWRLLTSMLSRLT